MPIEPTSALRVSALHWYPVKSCRGASLSEAVIGPRGIAGDRSFMVVDAVGRFLTQRVLPRMALVEPRVADDTLLLTVPGGAALSVPILHGGSRREVVIWRDNCVAIDQGDEAAAWLSDFLSVPCRLVRISDDMVRRVDPAFALRPTDQVSFADAYPFLLTTEASLADLNSRLSTPLPMDRFRPNIVVHRAAPYAEDSWGRIRIGEITFAVVKPCARCTITTVDQSSGERAREPLRTLARYRRVRGQGVMFGQNLVHESTGVIRVGDAVELLAHAGSIP